MVRFAVVMLVAACASDPDACPTTVAAYCADHGGCPMTWAAAQDPASWGCGSSSGFNVNVGPCGNVNLASVGYIDTGTSYFYDASGKLYRIETAGGAFGNMPKCVAGTGPATDCGVGQTATRICPPP